MAFPKGVNFQMYSNGKGALATYMALMLNTENNEVYAMYDIQTEMCNADQMIDFQNTYVNVIETVLKNPEAPLGEMF